MLDICPGYWLRRENGSVRQEVLPRSKWPELQANSVIQETGIYHWEPPYQLRRRLPNWFHLRLAYDVDTDGVRRFFPTYRLVEHQVPEAEREPGHMTYDLALVAGIGGYAILVDRGKIDESLLLTYEEARLFSQYVRHLREYFATTQKLEQRTKICVVGRETADSTDILPADVGCDGNGEGRRWSPAQLREEGLMAALDSGIENPGPDQIFRFGLLQAARRNPLYTRPNEVRSLFRMALFDLGPTTKPIPADDLKYVAEHVKKALEEHRDDTTEEFNNWLEDRKSDLINRIAKRKDCRLDRQGVRKALLELGWRSIEMLGQCVRVQMEAFRSVLPDPLSTAETPLFESLYQGSPSFGDLPMILLHERFTFLREAILYSWDDLNDDFAVAVVHRMMFYFHELVSKRRASDRRYKQSVAARNANNRASLTQGVVVESELRHGRDGASEFTRLACAVAARHDSDQDFSGDGWRAELQSSCDTEIEFRLHSIEHSFDSTYTVPLAEFGAARTELEENVAD